MPHTFWQFQNSFCHLSHVTPQHFCNNTLLFLQLHFAFLQHVPSTLRLNGTPLIHKTSRDKHAAPTDLWNEKVLSFRDIRGVTTDLHDTECNEKVLIFRDIRGVTTDLHDTEWNEKVLIFRDICGVTTDLLDV